MKQIIKAITYLSIFVAASQAYADISQIDVECSTIQKNVKSLEVSTVDISGQSTEGGEAKVYRDNKGRILYLVVDLYFESGRISKRYYLKNNSMIFASYQYFRYNVPFYVTPELAKDIGSESFNPDKTKVTEEKFYFDQSEMLQWSNEKAEIIPPDNPEFKEKAQEILKEISTLINKVRKT